MAKTISKFTSDSDDSSLKRKREVGIVVSTLGKGYRVLIDHEVWFCRVRGRLFLGKDAISPVVGDKVKVEKMKEARKGIIVEIEKRKSVLFRQMPETGIKQVLAANIDHVVICMALKDPPFRHGLVDRYLVACELMNLKPTILLNKIDLGSKSEIEQALEDFASIGYQTICVSAVTEQGICELKELLKDKCSVLTGPSGVGKTSMVNVICPTLSLQVGEVNEYTGKGRHTTTVSRLIDIGIGYLVDTPGLREFAPWGVEKEKLAECFIEMRDFIGNCKFRNCCHENEPDCAIKEAVTNGYISSRRYQSYLQLYRDIINGG